MSSPGASTPKLSVRGSSLSSVTSAGAPSPRTSKLKPTNSPEVRPLSKKGPPIPEIPNKPSNPPPLPTKPATAAAMKVMNCDLCGNPRLPISEDELLYAAIMPMSYRCYDRACGFMSKRYEPMESHKKQTDHLKIGMAHSDLGEVRCGFCKFLLEKDGNQ